MAEFSVKVHRLTHPIHDHPNADRLSLVRVLDFISVRAKTLDGQHAEQVGDLVVYIPEASVLPEALLKALGFWKDGKGTLAGGAGARVKAIELRKILSQGLLMPAPNGILTLPSGDQILVQEGQDVAEILGIVKYEPEIPAHMSGQVCNLFGYIPPYDFENLQNRPDMFDPGEMIQAGEKLHGTFSTYGYVPGLQHPECFGGGDFYVTSKGLGNKGLAFKNVAENAHNLYVKMMQQLLKAGFADHVKALSAQHQGLPVRVFGEIFGGGVQDLDYGLKKPALRVFDLRIGDVWATPDQVIETAGAWGLEVVPEVYRGPFDLDVIKHLRTNAPFSGAHVSEGLVLRSLVGSLHPIYGRKIAKSINPAYLLRKNKDATEFQ